MIDILLTWIGRTDLRAASGNPDAGLGPIAQAVRAGDYMEIHLINDFSASEAKAFVKWLAPQTDAKIALHHAKLSSPINFGEIYERVVEILESIGTPLTRLTYHLSPGTPAMASVWILLAKTTFPARLIQSSPQSGVEEANIPFDISAEFIPKLLQRSDERLANFADMGKSGWLEELKLLAEKEPWDYMQTKATEPLPILRSYVRYTFQRLEEMSGGIGYSANEQFSAINTGLVTPNQEELFATFRRNSKAGRQMWKFAGFKKSSDRSFVDSFGSSTPPLEIGRAHV